MLFQILWRWKSKKLFLKKNRSLLMNLFENYQTINFKKDELICVKNENSSDLYYIKSGKAMAFGNKGSQITPFVYISQGEFLCEFSFLDHQPRSSHVICIEDAEIVIIPQEELELRFPPWLVTYAQSIIGQIRSRNILLEKRGIKRKNVQTIQPLTNEEQGRYFQILKKENAL